MHNCDNCKVKLEDNAPWVNVNGPVFFCDACYYGNDMPKAIVSEVAA